MARPPLTAVPAQRSSLPTLQVRRRLVIGLLAGTSALGLVSTGAWIFQSDPVIPQVAARSEPAVSLANILVRDLVAGRDSSVPAALDVPTDFSRTAAGMFPQAEVSLAGTQQVRLGGAGGATTMLVQRSSFDVVVPASGDTPAQFYAVSVPMVQTADGWLLAASPSIIPIRAAKPVAVPGYANLFGESGDSSALAKLSYGSAVVSQVERWANAFAAEGVASPELFALTGARDTSMTFDGLGGWSASQVTVKSFVLSPNSAEERSAGFGDERIVVRVGLLLSRGGANGPTLSTEYDLLLQPSVNPGQPPVTAWGPANAGPTSALTNYQNANLG